MIQAEHWASRLSIWKLAICLGDVNDDLSKKVWNSIKFSDGGFPPQSMCLTNPCSFHSFSWTELTDLRFVWQFARDDLNFRNHSSTIQNAWKHSTHPSTRHRSPVEDMCLDENFSLQWRLRRQKLFPKPVKQFPWEDQCSKKMTAIPLCWCQNASYQKGERPEMMTWKIVWALKWIVFRVWSYSNWKIFTVFRRSQISVRRQTQKRGLRVLFAQHWVWHFHLILMPRGAQICITTPQRSVMLASLSLALNVSHNRRPRPWKQWLLEWRHPGRSNGLRKGKSIEIKTFQGPLTIAISFLGTIDIMLAAFHIWKSTELGTIDYIEYWIPSKTNLNQPLSTDVFPTLMHISRYPASNFWAKQGPQKPEPKQLQTIEGKVSLKISSIWLVTFPTQIVAQTGNKTNEDIGTFSAVKASVGPFLPCCFKASLQYFQI